MTGITKTAGSASLTNPGEAVAANLYELYQVISSLTDAAYSLPSDPAFRGSIGAHVRHCLDHVEALLKGIDTGRVEYDKRERGTEIETNRKAALARIKHLHDMLLKLNPEMSNQPITVELMMLSSEPPRPLRSTIGRELAFILSHTIHHNALIAVMARIKGTQLPEKFGYAPATLAYIDHSGN